MYIKFYYKKKKILSTIFFKKYFLSVHNNMSTHCTIELIPGAKPPLKSTYKLLYVKMDELKK
jgi:hypothetical protein